ncbi:MAG TPA: hypothetical protein VKH82_13060 [Candidatus Binatia bacterium]|nr:hypothetical protein [Candidatus Binatia bacterium]
MTARFTHFPALLSDPGAADMIRLCEHFGSYGMYGQKPIEEELGHGLYQRQDAAMNYIRTGGRFGRRESFEQAAVRTNYFRETYAYDQPVVDGIEGFLWHEGFLEAARATFDCPVIAPAIVYANLLVPGQELAVHTDVPEFRGANRTKDPEWLLVVMHHSGLFARWRIPIATGVAWFHGCRGGDFAFYPDGAGGRPATVPPAHNTAILLDTDSVFHGVDRVAEGWSPLPPLRIGMRLTFENGGWRVGAGDETVASYAWDDLRFSVSWKGYCFPDEASQRIAREHTDDLTRDQIMRTLLADLRLRGRLGDTVPGGTDLALLLIDEYVRFPAPTA